MENATSPLLITQQDYERLSQLLNISHGKYVLLLEEELARAQIVPQDEVANDIVTMNSKVTFLDKTTNKETEITLVYPKDANADKGLISILTPVGSALIGLKKGQKIQWPFPNGTTKELVVTEIAYQPEANKEWHL